MTHFGFTFCLHRTQSSLERGEFSRLALSVTLEIAEGYRSASRPGGGGVVLEETLIGCLLQ
jgi:hypothetical protein